MPKFAKKLYAFVYSCLIDFPELNVDYDTVTTTNFFHNVDEIIKVKVHLHYSHVTGEILGYAQDFCNWRLRENKTDFVCLTHNVFGFGMVFLM